MYVGESKRADMDPDSKKLRDQRRNAKLTRKNKERAALEYPPIEDENDLAQFVEEHTEDEYVEFLSDGEV